MLLGNMPSAWAKYGRPQLENVPVERVLTNLADKAAAKPQDAALRFNLARAYAMAFASKAEQFEVRAQTPDAIWFGFEPMNVPFVLKPTENPAKQAAAEKNLAKAIETYEAALKLAPDNAVGRLGYGWCLDQAGQKEAARAEYRKALADGWKAEETRERAGPGFRSVTAEAAGYLKPLLDKEKDAAEIKDLDAKVAKVSQIRRGVTPIAVPLADGLRASHIEDRSASVAFDADGSAVKDRRWSWIKPSAAWLVIDKQNTGKVDSALQMFGNVTFWMFWQHGYEPLAALDDNDDGELRGAELAGLCLWHDANQNGVSDAGEVRSLSEHGIVAISCAHEVDAMHVDRIEFSPRGVTFANGSTRPTFDVRLRRR
jgi:tetratricopeptide (TPR) repeat protein